MSKQDRNVDQMFAPSGLLSDPNLADWKVEQRVDRVTNFGRSINQNLQRTGAMDDEAMVRSS